MKNTTKKIVRTLSLVLAVIMLAATFTGCSLKDLSWKMTYRSILKQLNREYNTVNYTLYDVDSDFDNIPELIVEVYYDVNHNEYLLYDAAKGNYPVIIIASSVDDCRVSIYPYEVTGGILICENYLYGICESISEFRYNVENDYYDYLPIITYKNTETHLVLNKFDMHSDINDILFIDWYANPSDGNVDILNNFIDFCELKGIIM